MGHRTLHPCLPTATPGCPPKTPSPLTQPGAAAVVTADSQGLLPGRCLRLGSGHGRGWDRGRAPGVLYRVPPPRPGPGPGPGPSRSRPAGAAPPAAPAAAPCWLRGGSPPTHTHPPVQRQGRGGGVSCGV